MAVQGVSGLAVAAAGAGALLAWSGLRGASVSGTLRELLSGQQPTGTNLHPITTPTGSPSAISTPVTATGSTIASDALKYVGHAYLFGGAPGTSGQSPWDCSSFANWVLGHDLGMTLPGSSTPGYDGSSHGPTTLSYLVWSRAQTVGHSPSDAQAGDLCVWQTHMGIATGGGQMVSALDAQLGTKVTTISGGAPAAEVLSVRRIIIGNPNA